MQNTKEVDMICAGAHSTRRATFSGFTSKNTLYKQLVSSLSNAVTFIKKKNLPVFQKPAASIFMVRNAMWKRWRT